MTVANQVHRSTKAEKITGTLSSPNEKNQELPPTNQNGESERRIRKKCLGCGDNFIGSPSENSDYCRNCEINRKILKENRHSVSKLHHLTGIITGKEPYKVYNKGPHHGNQCYKLQVIFENEEEKQNLFIYPNLVDPQILHTIEQTQYLDKRYLFSCEKKKRGWILHNWEELGSNLNLANHEQEK